MNPLMEIRVPDIGRFQNVPVIEVLVKPGDVILAEQALVTLESDKATMDVPSPRGGRIVEVRVAVGDRLSTGSLLALMAAEESGTAPDARATASALSAPPVVSPT